MPPVSQQQRKAMRAAAASPKVAKQMGIPQKVAREFNKSDPGGKLPRTAADYSQGNASQSKGSARPTALKVTAKRTAKKNRR